MNTHTSRFRRHVSTGLLFALFPLSLSLATRDTEVVTVPNEESLHTMRHALVQALAKNGSREHLDEFRKMAMGDDLGLASAAVHALSDLKSEDAIQDLAWLTRKGSKTIRLQAVGSLSGWPESQEALEAILEASHS